MTEQTAITIRHSVSIVTLMPCIVLGDRLSQAVGNLAVTSYALLGTA